MAGEGLFKALVENALDLILVLDGEAVVRFVSPSIERMLGYQRDDLVGRSVLEFVHPLEIPNARASLMRRLGAAGSGGLIEVPVRHVDGSWRVFEAVGQSFIEDSGQTRVIVNAR